MKHPNVLLGVSMSVVLIVLIFILVLFEATQTTTLTDISYTAQEETRPDHPVIYVSIASHNEDTLSNNYPNYVEDEKTFWQQRDLLIQFANMLHKHDVEYNFQTDWNFLLGIAEYDNGTISTRGKNILEYLVEDLNFSVDPHSHENLGYNYADVAYLIDSLGVEPSGVVGGMIVKPVEDSLLETFWEPMTANKYNYTWEPTLLWGGGTAFHVDETDVWISGVWQPKSKEELTTHDASAPLPNVGNFQSSWDGLELLVDMLEADELYADQMYTVTIMNGQHLMSEESIAEFEEQLKTYDALTAQGYIEWVTIQEAYDIWVEQYDSYGAIMLYDGTHLRP